MATHLPTQYDLFLDESGSFMETSTVPAERAEAFQQGRLFPSQLAGLLVPRGALTEGAAKQARNRALDAVGLPPQPVHGNDLLRAIGKERYSSLITELISELRRQAWQPVRLVNREQVRYGDRVATYTHLVAELILRICQQQHLQGAGPISLRVYAARVRLGETPEGEIILLPREEYLRRIREYLGFAAVRRGLARTSGAWRLEDLHLRSGKDAPELHLCDMLSHASHDDFHPIQAETARLLRDAFGPYDFSLSYLEVIERVDQHLAGDAPGLAVLFLAERVCGEPVSDELRDPARKRLEEIRTRLAQLGAPARDQHLALLSGWLEQIIEVRRAIELGDRLSTWLLDEVVTPLGQLLAGGPEAGSVDWFAYALRTWNLTAANHRGALRDARRQTGELEKLLPSLAGQWEHATLLMRGLVAQGVHLTDCFEHETASKRMEVAAKYYGELGSLFHVILPDVFPERVRSDLHGRVLGTWLQSEVLAGLCRADASRLDRARRLSEQAIDEFPAEADKERQYQYRSQLEAAAGNFAEARIYLARSLRLKADSHEAIASAIVALAEQSPFAEGFAHLHWFRLGVTACLDGNQEDATAFLAAVEHTGALDWRWSRADGPADYPAHGILRRAAVLRGLRSEADLAVENLRRLAHLLSGKQAGHFVLQTVNLAAHAETAAVLASRQAKTARRLLDSTAEGCHGLKQMLAMLQTTIGVDFPGIWQVFSDWPPVIDAALRENLPSEAHMLSRLARRIGY
jgi:tetratricopeptide (TPR) repeat protein